MFPGLREIFLVRDFRDMLCSILAYNEARGLHAFGRDPDETDEQYARRLGPSVHELATAYVERAGEAHVVKYEDLVARPAETLGEAFRYLEVEAGEQRVEEALAAASSASSGTQRLHGTTASAAQSVGRWHEDLPPALARTCEEAFGEALRVFGYDVSRRAG
jgi:cobalamin biosynthesis Mg chelatase CobN